MSQNATYRQESTCYVIKSRILSGHVILQLNKCFGYNSRGRWFMTNQGKQTIDRCNYRPPTECPKVMSTEGEGVPVTITHDALDLIQPSITPPLQTWDMGRGTTQPRPHPHQPLSFLVIRRLALLIGFELVFISQAFQVGVTILPEEWKRGPVSKKKKRCP